ncbi:MAG: hypothetical protein EPO51_19080 [Phenylobacterium sp.]|uniref:hypothetical protein n=1 Tax=Phenylobacterium sp. TaxID=1871053 RepID=UPI00121001C3|nr:hypothetical protein [Phenylobacterium sp.]TAJ70199.1 MAG: hypothetical protein EPO51_19080 [Phenylobacterium sp.]
MPGPREPAEERTRKYLVAPHLGLWSVTRDTADQGAFTLATDATTFACGLARADADGGLIGMVVVEAAVQELHCFTPRMVTARPRRTLRLIHASAASDER